MTWQAKPKKDKEALRQEASKKLFELLTTGLVWVYMRVALIVMFSCVVGMLLPADHP